MSDTSSSSAPPINPVVYFSSGSVGRPFRQKFMGHLNRNEIDAAQQVLDEGILDGEFSHPYHQANLRGLIEVKRNRPQDGERLFIEAEALATTPGERASAILNQTLIHLGRGDWNEVIRLCRAGIDIAPQVEGLWCNLLIGLDRAGLQEQLGVVLAKLPEIFDLAQGARLLTWHLRNDSDLDGVRQHKVFHTIVLPLITSQGG